MPEFKDYDSAVAEIEERWYEFRFGGEDFKANLNIDGGLMLSWLDRSSQVDKAQALPELLRHVLGDGDYDRLIKTRQQWNKYEALMLDIFQELGGLGNEDSPSTPGS